MSRRNYVAWGGSPLPPARGRLDEAATARELILPEVGVLYEGTVARAHGPGDPLTYEEGDEYRTVEELHRMVAQMPGTPITLNHPSTMIREGGKATIVGKITSARVDGDRAVARMRIHDPDARAAIVGGVRQLSLGYLARLDARRYQIDTSIDHMALVPRARCGATCSISGRLDSAARAHRDCGTDHACGCGLPPRFDADSNYWTRLLELARTANAAPRFDAETKISPADVAAMIAEIKRLEPDYPSKNTHPAYVTTYFVGAIDRAERTYQTALQDRARTTAIETALSRKETHHG